MPRRWIIPVLDWPALLAAVWYALRVVVVEKSADSRGVRVQFEFLDGEQSDRVVLSGGVVTPGEAAHEQAHHTPVRRGKSERDPGCRRPAHADGWRDEENPRSQGRQPQTNPAVRQLGNCGRLLLRSR
jgi:hypothetical protein